MSIEIYTHCRWCNTQGGDDYETTLQEYAAWKDGQLIQDAMPNLNSTQRETLMSGMCAKCQEVHFS